MLFVYATWWSASLALVGIRRSTFSAGQRAYANLGVRAVLGVVVLAALFHTLDGVRRMLSRGNPSVRGRLAVAYLTWAVGLPSMLLILWPSVKPWFG